jgi:hypothetical protein
MARTPDEDRVIIGVHLLVRHLDVAGFSALALYDSDNLEVITANPYPFTNTFSGGQQSSGAKFRQNNGWSRVFLVDEQKYSSGQDLPINQVEPFRRGSHNADLQASFAEPALLTQRFRRSGPLDVFNTLGYSQMVLVRQSVHTHVNQGSVRAGGLIFNRLNG